MFDRHIRSARLNQKSATSGSDCRFVSKKACIKKASKPPARPMVRDWYNLFSDDRRLAAV